MPSIDKETEKRVVSFLREVHIAVFLERSNEKIKRVLDLIEKMPELEKQVITRKYIHTDAEYTRHQEIYRDMGISSGLYSKIRLSALTKIAAEFGLQSLEEVGSGKG